MNKNSKILPIFFAVDNDYIPFLSVTLKSLLEHTTEENKYIIKILYTDIKKENQNKIKKYERPNVNIEFVDLSYYINKIKNKLYTRDYYSKTTYFRLFIPDLYPQYNKALYLDSDTLILEDIANLYNIEIGDNLLGAIPDSAVQSVPEFQEYVEKVVGVSSYKQYFNAGILIMNLDELRKFKFQDKFLYLLDTIKYSVAQDQDYLNRLCKGRVKIIDGAWNKMPIDNYKKDDIKLIHYNLNYKPWHFDDILYKEYFWNYAEKTEYYNQIKDIKNNYTEEQRFNDLKATKNLIELAKKESACVGDDRKIKWEIT